METVERAKVKALPTKGLLAVCTFFGFFDDRSAILGDNQFFTMMEEEGLESGEKMKRFVCLAMQNRRIRGECSLIFLQMVGGT